MKDASSKLMFILLFVNACYSQELVKALSAKFGTENVAYIDSSAFKEYYEIKFSQPIDHKDLSKGYFKQIVLLGHNNKDKPMVIETNGYEILPYQDIKYVSEPAQILDANQIIVEHRFFGRSIPDPNNKLFLNFEQITADYHNIKNVFKDFYKGEWIATGASKGGLTTLKYNYHYPDDIAVSFVYVAPVLDDLEDQCIKSFLDQKRSTEIGIKLYGIQQHLLDRKQILLPIFLDILKLSNLELGIMDPETLYDLAVLEFDFNYWQYISDWDKLVNYNKRTIDEMSKNGLKNTSNLISEKDYMIASLPMCSWYFLDRRVAEPYYYQSFTEMGSYGYEEHLFTGLKHSFYSPEFLAGEHPEFMQKDAMEFNNFLNTRLQKTIFIYGAEDPWTACKANISATNDNLTIINPGTNHSTLIKDISAKEKQMVKMKLENWLKHDVIKID